VRAAGDDDFAGRLEAVMACILCKLTLDLLPGFLAGGFGQACKHLAQRAERFSLEADTLRSGAETACV
jgi:hypothetical protein